MSFDYGGCFLALSADLSLLRVGTWSSLDQGRQVGWVGVVNQLLGNVCILCHTRLREGEYVKL